MHTHRHAHARAASPPSPRHRCQPNCFSKIIEVGSRTNDKHIVVYAARDLQVGKELLTLTHTHTP